MPSPTPTADRAQAPAPPTVPTGMKHNNNNCGISAVVVSAANVVRNLSAVNRAKFDAVLNNVRVASGLNPCLSQTLWQAAVSSLTSVENGGPSPEALTAIVEEALAAAKARCTSKIVPGSLEYFLWGHAEDFLKQHGSLVAIHDPLLSFFALANLAVDSEGIPLDHQPEAATLVKALAALHKISTLLVRTSSTCSCCSKTQVIYRFKICSSPNVKDISSKLTTIGDLIAALVRPCTVPPSHSQSPSCVQCGTLWDGLRQVINTTELFFFIIQQPNCILNASMKNHWSLRCSVTSIIYYWRNHFFTQISLPSGSLIYDNLRWTQFPMGETCTSPFGANLPEGTAAVAFISVEQVDDMGCPYLASVDHRQFGITEDGSPYPLTPSPSPASPLLSQGLMAGNQGTLSTPAPTLPAVPATKPPIALSTSVSNQNFVQTGLPPVSRRRSLHASANVGPWRETGVTTRSMAAAGVTAGRPSSAPPQTPTRQLGTTPAVSEMEQT